MRKLVLLFLLLPLHPIVAQQPARPAAPENLSPPTSEKLILQAHATGFQIYVCQTGSDPDKKLAWILKAPDARLFNAQNVVIAKHYAGPTWKHNDGSEVVGKVESRHEAPDADAVPWLLLTAVSHAGNGVFANVTLIQRLNTKGGQPPQSGCDESHRNAETRSPYSADYYFYALNN
jgi:hypothetical protein